MSSPFEICNNGQFLHSSNNSINNDNGASPAMVEDMTLSSSLSKTPSKNNETENIKQLLCIRHGISISNEWMAQPGNRWGEDTFHDSGMIDAPLSETGQQTTLHSLQQQLHDDPSLHTLLQNVELVLVSPLTRCLQTYTMGVEPVLKECFQNPTDNEDGAQRMDTKKKQSFPPILALPVIRERVYTASDTGRPIHILEQEFLSIQFKECYDGDLTNNDNRNGDAPWWFTHRTDDVLYVEWRPHGQGQYYAVLGEPEDVFEERLQDFDRWLAQRPEQIVLIISHWGVLRHMSNNTMEWGNAQAKVLTWSNNTDVSTGT